MSFLFRCNEGIGGFGTMAASLLLLLPFCTLQCVSADSTPREEYFGKLDSFNGPSVSMTDPKLIRKIRDKFLVPPPESRRYRLRHPEIEDPSLEGEVNKIRSIFCDKKNGFFVEAGAWDGERQSNTLYLERFKNWTGLLIEADPLNFGKLVHANRRAWTSPSCVSVKPYPEIVRFDQNENVGKIVNTGVKPWAPYSGRRTDVQCFPLYSFLLALNVTSVDFLSLDIEGGELDILKTIPLNLIDIKTLTVEFTHVQEGKDGVVSFMTQNGYVLHSVVNYDLIFVKPNSVVDTGCSVVPFSTDNVSTRPDVGVKLF